jgi:hypothetical protein
MFQATILTSVAELAKEFERCCREYDSLQFATAWRQTRDTDLNAVQRFGYLFQASAPLINVGLRHPRYCRLQNIRKPAPQKPELRACCVGWTS